ncbi:alpha-2-macroglobulin-like [Spea bombifrons]|uniref:alpha-2-macroglobulin-like n=1 Tax=Spea bombifrons TaxID=233779 RepID=UPI00234B38D6|nr:alpha-2-macroglobulin-like [Spea bombifrons]
MLPRVLYAGLILMQVSWTLETKLHYAVVVPSEIIALRPQLACFDIEGAKGESSIQLSLSTVNGNSTLVEKTFNKDSLFSCVSFQVPNPTEENEEVATLDVSIHSSSESVSKKTKVLLKKERNGILVQTDKPIYKPGQTVKFRVLSIKENLQPRTHQIPVIELQDPGKNRIGQWLNVNLNQGIAEFSFPLSDEPVMGEYSIKVKDHVHPFSVEEYVLPKFEVSLEFPKVVMFNSDHFPVKVCSRYTYGKPVQGVYSGSVCRKRYTYSWRQDHGLPLELCKNITGRLDKSGCSTTELKSDNFNLTSNEFQLNLEGTASVTEDGTGVELSTSSGTSISNTFDKVSFIDADNSYKAGIPYSGKLKVEDAIGNPIADKEVYLSCSNHGHTEELTLITDKNGQAVFKLENTNNWQAQTTITAKTNKENVPYKPGIIQPLYGYAHLSLSPFYSKSKSFLKLHSLQNVLPCEGQQEVQVEYIIQHTELEKEAKHLDLHYLMTSRGSILDSGSIEIPINNPDQDLSGSSNFKLPLSVEASPNLQVIVFTLLPGGEIIADSAKYTVTRCFQNKVSVGFTPDEVLPGSDVSLQVRADAGSLCGLRVVDKSVVLMKPEKELTADKVHSLFHFYDYGGYDYRIQEDEPHCFPGRWPTFPRVPLTPRLTRSIIRPWFRDEHVDVYSLFKNLKLKIMTDADIMKPLKCDRYFTLGIPFASPGLPGSPEIQARIPTRGNVLLDSGPANAIPDAPQKVETVRKDFPETWIFELAAVGQSGSTELHHKAPDTITDWNAGAFCMGPSGFGLSSPASLRTFQPFFVDVTLPYSVVRGETFILKATVFNYLKECIKVKTTLKLSEQLEEEPCADCQYTSCVCSDESKTFYWNLKASKLGEVNITVSTEALETQDLCNNEHPIVPKHGQIDTVIKPLLVQPGGVLEEKTYNHLICPQKGEGESKPVKISLKVPENILKDSERAYMSVLGDLMGTAMQNLDRLLAMPYGCGEQNMVLFSPNIFILQYLEKTHQLNDEIQTKAKKFLESGYQRQLTYKHDDGSYSAFGKNDKEGNTWLTAFVVKSFNNARPYIFIDESHLNHSFTWLKNNRQDNGCFRSVGKLFNNAMKGGVDDEISLSAYVTVALLESGIPPEDPLVRDALLCLRKAATDVTSVYTQALLAYTFTLAGETDLRQSLLEKLYEKAVRGDGQLHWERKPPAPSSEVPSWYQAPSAEVEMTSYVLLALLSGPTKDVGKASEIVNWLSKQQNPYGGYISTQDTIVALQAMAKYSEVTFSDKGDVSVIIRSHVGVRQIHVDHDHRLLLLKFPLSEIPGDYFVSTSGSGCVFVQAVLRYNVPPSRSDETFEIKVEIKPDQCPEEPLKKFNMQISAKYTGSREKSNMALIEVKMLSGFIPVKSSVRELEKSKLVQRSDIQTDMVTLYLDELGHDPIHLSFMVEQDIEVKNLKPATVKVYDYYETGEFAIAEYNSPCSSDAKLNAR